MPRGLQLLLLSCACSLARAAREVKVACSQDAELPCPAPRDPHVAYNVTWVKTRGCGETLVAAQEDPHPSQKGSTEAPSGDLYSLKIRNTSCCHSGEYRCTLQGPTGQSLHEGTVILKVTGCPKEDNGDSFSKHTADIMLLLVLVVFYITLIVFTFKFARYQIIFPDFSKPGMKQAFFESTFPQKPLELVILHKTDLV
ncbi:CD83 antigen [Talpa occidentalis]|uniref:CD83 antigen n=1 Tax=Talpa occidentalis TaxID=50954 RepID=UPI001890017F|nr:CD83 antigen [Talpa occidentalis]